MLELKDFIAKTMTSIVKGIQQGQADEDVGDHIAPLIQGEKRNEFGNFYLKEGDQNQATVLQFEVSVAAKSSDSNQVTGAVEAKLYVVDLNLGGGKKGSEEHSSVHKLKFAIPIKIPKREK